MSVRVAVASTDGKVVNQHFGHADIFYLFEIDTDNNRFDYIDKRGIEPCCNSFGHSQQAFENVAEKISDCKAIIVSQIGEGAVNFFESKGFEVVEAPYLIVDVLNKILQDKLI